MAIISTIMAWKRSKIAQTPWHLKMQPKTVDVQSDPIPEEPLTGKEAMIRSIDVAYVVPNATPREVWEYFRKDIEKSCIQDGYTLSELVADPIRVVKGQRLFAWTINVLLKKSEISSKDIYFGLKPGSVSGNSGSFPHLGGVVKRVMKPKEMGDIFK
ncbi:MAG: hypothetical protein M1275_03305 [Patescibacteria group bacterium]|nr:hypothetical protein [Patescibacteria group bacterium]